jgi:effector-binding domain-containing protein
MAALLIVGLILPRHLRVEVSAVIDAPTATVFALINDFHRVDLWAPIRATDPNARIVYSGPTRGVGATVTWDGAIVGIGTQTITASQPFEQLETVLEAEAAAIAHTRFELARQDGGTGIAWAYDSDLRFNLIARCFAFVRARTIRREFEHDLAGLKEMAESLPAADFSDLEIEQIVVEPLTIAYLTTTSVPEPAAISDAMGDAYFAILNFIDEHGLQEAGAPMSITRSFSGSQLVFDAAIPVRGIDTATMTDSATVRIGTTWSGPVLRVRHVGPYRDLATTHRKIAAYLAATGIERAGAAWESYVSDPTRVAESDLLTYIYYPIGP